ncbi:SDR family NAD(P)-dependent oxidoreductase [Pararhodospirillum photometricum]|uniref:Short-chain dehydrogenase/reductase SDR n=1 Tax=Pararhodospirillum photometricum DSM 122 TaxID=1150469 RepID=H6SLL6_PARPM|nr:SDR family NAD(P)-dependent oxidoreductase [Pararhodospirillum photometricum]CCG08881.1 Short-chain dehydrogenase/reductase SDR [Pararhodospirillum photometricum DSM 122]
MTPAPTRILITGASSGLGHALALAYAAPGRQLVLGARRPLDAVAEACRAQGAQVETTCVDVTDQAATAAWVVAADQSQPLDLVIANAGISGGTAAGSEPQDLTRALFATNLDGVLNTVCPLLERFQARRAGQIALMASLAGFRGFPGAPAYCASKAAVRVWGEGLRGLMAPHGVRVSVICPGFVRTPMTDVNPFPMPFLMPPEVAAQRIVRGLARNQGRISFPLPLVLATHLIAALPDAWAGRLTAQAPRKPGR